MRTYKNWVDKSWRLPSVGDNPFLAMDFQSLGRLDIDLVELWASRKELIDKPQDETEELFNLQEAFKQQRAFEYSRLWVLAGYEIAMQLKNNGPEKFQEVYNAFRNVRVPLARYEKAGENGGPQHIAMPGIRTDTGDIGWEIEQGVFVARDELAKKLLDTV